MKFLREITRLLYVLTHRNEINAMLRLRDAVEKCPCERHQAISSSVLMVLLELDLVIEKCP